MKGLRCLLQLALICLVGFSLTACSGVQMKNAKVYPAKSAVPFENDVIVVVNEQENLRRPYAKYNAGEPVPTQEFIAAAYYDTQKPVLDEREARALNRLMLAQGFDLVTTKVGINRGCVEGNSLFAKAGGAFNWPGALIWATGSTLLYAIPARQSSIEQSLRQKDTWHINAGAGFKTAVGVKNLLTKC